MKERRQEIEEEIARLEHSIAESETALATFSSAEETARLTKLVESQRSQLQCLMGEWEETSQVLETNA